MLVDVGSGQDRLELVAIHLDRLLRPASTPAYVNLVSKKAQAFQAGSSR